MCNHSCELSGQGNEERFFLFFESSRFFYLNDKHTQVFPVVNNGNTKESMKRFFIDFSEQNVSGMLDLLLPLHEKLERGADTKRETDFLQSFGEELAQAHAHVKEYIRIATTGGLPIPRGPAAKSGSARMTRQMEEAETAMNKAWDLYYIV